MNFRVLLNCAPTSTQLISASTKFFATPSPLLEPKYHMKLGNFPKSRWKIQSCPFYLKIGAHSISRMLILIPTLVFFVFSHKSISGQIHAKKVNVVHFAWNFGKIWAKKVKVVHFAWKLAHMVSPGWFLWTLVFWISNPKSIFGKIWAKKSQSCLFC